MLGRFLWRTETGRQPVEAAGRSRSFDWPTTAVGLVLIVVLLGLHAWNPGLIEAARLKVFDQYARMKPREALQPSPVVIIDIDEASLEQIGQWPWPRNIFAELIDRLAAMQAAVIVFDVIFAETDRLSPPEYAATLNGVDSSIIEGLRALPGNDQTMADAMARHRVVLGQPASTVALEQKAEDQALAMTVAEINGDPRPHLAELADIVRSVPVLESAAQGVGLVSFDADLDGIVRRVPGVVNVGGRIVPTLAIETLRVATAQPTIAIRSGASGVESILLQGVAIPTDEEGHIWVHYAPPGSERYVSASDVLAGRVDAGEIANRVAMIGASAAGLGDIKSTPVAGRMPGVEVHAQLLETIYTNDHLRRPGYAPGAERLFFVGIGLLVAVFGPLLSARALPILLLVSMAAAVATSWYAFAEQKLLIDAAYPSLVIVILVLWLALAKYMREQAMVHSIRNAFGQYLSPVMVDRLAHEPDQLKLTGETRDLTIMFSDIRGFTTLSEAFGDSPEDLTRFMNQYLTAMTDEIMQRSGTIDKYIGDAIMAFWNAPLDVREHERLACMTALAMVEAVRRLGAEQADQDLPTIAIGVGINTGPCYVGNMGSDQRFNYSVLGDPVNVASRLEGQSKTYGVSIVVGDTTMESASDMAGLRLDLVRLKGKTQPVWLFGLLGDVELARSEAFVALTDAHEAMLQAYRAQDWDGATRHLESCRPLGEEFGLDTLYSLYDERVAAMRAEPPGSDWDGVYVALSK